MELSTAKPLFGLASDLHLDFAAMNPEFFEWRGDVLLLAGDLAEEDTLRKKTDFWDQVQHMAKEVYVISGNHEYYGSEIDTADRHLSEFLKAYPNIRLLQDECVETHGVMLFGGTLWADFEGGKPTVMWVMRQRMNDYHRIRVANKGYSKLTPEQTMRKHRDSLEALQAALQQYPDKPFLVMTHHAPSFESIRRDYANHELNGAYATNLEQLIINNRQIQAWVHGHIHTHKSYDVEGCMVIVNARGYPGERPNHLPPYMPQPFQLEY